MALYRFKEIESEKYAQAKKVGKPPSQAKIEVDKMRNRLLANEELRSEFLKDRKLDPCILRRIRDSIQASTMYMHELARENAKARFMSYVSFRSEKFHLKYSYVSFIK